MDRRPLRHDPHPQHGRDGERVGEPVGVNDRGPRGREPVKPGDGITGPLLLWLVVQLLALGVAVFRLPLAAGYPQPGELLAAHVMVVIQVTTAALVFPYLMRSWSAAIAVVAAGLPFVVLAGVLSGTPKSGVIGAAGYLTAWLIALGALNAALPQRSRLLGIIAATLFCVGSLILYYLDLEFSAGAETWKSMSPPLAALRQLRRDAHARDWSLVAIAAVLAAVIAFLRRRRDQVIHNS